MVNSMTPIYPPGLSSEDGTTFTACYSLSSNWELYTEGYFCGSARYYTLVPELQVTGFNKWYIQRYGGAAPTNRRGFLILQITSEVMHDIVNSAGYDIKDFPTQLIPLAELYTNEPHWFLDVSTIPGWNERDKLIGTGQYYIDGVKISSIPYDLTGTGVK